MDKAGDAVRSTEEIGSRQSERRLIAQAKLGDQAAVRELIDLHKDRLFAFLWRMVRNHHDAEEICQDAFLKAFASLASFSDQYRFSTWLFTIGYRVCLNRLRRKQPLTGDLEFAALPDRNGNGSASLLLESEEAAELKDLVWTAVDQLSPPQRASVLLFYRQEFSCMEIARVLEVPVATVKSHLHRARHRLRVVLESLSENELSRIRNFRGFAG